ncbi:uncharacterized protein LOC123545766 [Mercenaria mercenaria]|uniref:uncharacterized protein LOC123545766 n=1 Tax=Mercenaria mercenaria TaxID=6596 RepID=UPI00234E96BF|nr:uncharacterized protein LOC123545766 [Mercenaria mercenaria]
MIRTPTLYRGYFRNMVDIKLSVAVFLLQICCSFAVDDSWFTELQRRMDTLEKQGVEQRAINLQQQEMLHEQDRQLAHTNNLVIELKEFIAAQTLELEKQRNATENLNEHMNKLSTLVVERDAEVKVLTAGIADLRAELEVTKVTNVKLSENASNKLKPDVSPFDETPSEILKTLNKDTPVQSNSKQTTVKIKASREDTLSFNSSLMNRQNRLVLNQEGPFAFHAVSDKHEIPHLQIDQSILFETVLLNIGGAYHSNHSLFIAETPGVYLFSVSILSFVNDRSEYTAALVKNGGNLALIYGHGDSGRHDQGSVTVVTQLKAGDEVWVKLLSSADDSIYGGRYTTFSGVMLYYL